MSIKRFCDQCGKEITEKLKPNGNLGRITATLGELKVEVCTAYGKTWNAGDFCKYCILDALYTVDDRRENIIESVIL